MRKIMIVGAGQSGLQLGFGLLAAGYEVSLVTNRTGEDIRTGKVMSSQCMFHTSLQIERDMDLNQWERDCPAIDGIGLAVPNPEQKGARLIDWGARLRSPAQSVDQRVKIPGWMDAFKKAGGELILKDAGVDDLETYAKSHDLVIVSSGKGEISKLFERDAAKSTFDKPQRALALTYVKGMRPRNEFSAVCFNLIPTVGEYFVFPALTTTGPCEIMVFEGIPGGPMDCWADVKTPEEHLAKSKWILDTFLPWEAERCKDIQLTDDNGILAGRFAPTVRRPVATLPSGRKILGMADVVVLNDPITGQGSNNAAKCADVYLKSIVEHGDKPADPHWMQHTFDRYWYGYSQWVTQWTNMLLMPPPPHVLNLLGAAGAMPPLATAIVNGFDDPRTFFPWFADPAESERFIGQWAAAA
ncbi:FAD-binding oxidoreductase [Variovorax sp. J22R133]|uniref:styrene monooxygenase/indole monooxygenase family protein n=1 Tax=Variovorax brevis TaxID=3053503 RepID=UPI002575439A|nr:styrene monooxygenase/indole monooxygenase family protein [Variovorax sp. J22R133]MDM0117379.1 FAD-binding oxidoreductase [Variovorax sp. J22R133]